MPYTFSVKLLPLALARFARTRLPVRRLLRPWRRRRFDLDELEVDEALDGIHARDDDVHARTQPEATLAVASDPGASTRLHRVFIVSQVVHVQEAVRANRRELDK